STSTSASSVQVLRQVQHKYCGKFNTSTAASSTQVLRQVPHKFFRHSLCCWPANKYFCSHEKNVGTILVQQFSPLLIRNGDVLLPVVAHRFKLFHFLFRLSIR